MALFKKLIFLFPLFFLVIFLWPKNTKAEVSMCTDPDPNKCVDFYQAQLDNSHNQERTLSGEITYMDNQINLTEYQISATEQKLGKLTDNIASVSGKIDSLQSQLSDTSELLLNRIVTTYKQGQGDKFLPILFSNDFNNAVIGYEYLKIVQKHDQELLEQMSIIRSNYQDQKSNLEASKQEKEALKKQLDAYQASLTQKKLAKENLLRVTQNDESRYQELLSEARAQAAAFKGFVASLGGATLLSNQTSCDGWGCYYNQRDSQWGGNRIGNSNDSLAEVGCLVTSSAMVLSHYGHKVTPADVARNSGAFFADTSLMLLSPWGIDGATFNRTNYGRDMGTLDSELSSGHPVIVGIDSGAHFIVFKSKDGGDYKIYDPFVPNGHDISFLSQYGSLSRISYVNVIRVN